MFQFIIVSQTKNFMFGILKGSLVINGVLLNNHAPFSIVVRKIIVKLAPPLTAPSGAPTITVGPLLHLKVCPFQVVFKYTSSFSLFDK